MRLVPLSELQDSPEVHSVALQIQVGIYPKEFPLVHVAWDWTTSLLLMLTCFRFLRRFRMFRAGEIGGASGNETSDSFWRAKLFSSFEFRLYEMMVVDTVSLCTFKPGSTVN